MIFQKPYVTILIIAILTTPYLNFGDFGAQILMLLVATSIPNGRECFLKRKELKVICSIFIAAATYSFMLFLSGHLDFKYLSRGISSSLYRIIEVFFCYKMLNYYGKKAFVYCFAGLVCAYSINIILALFTFGLGGVVQAFFSIFSFGFTGEGSDTNEILESCHAVLLIMPFIAVFFLHEYIKNREISSLRIFIISAIISLLAFKRIAIGASIIIFTFLFLQRLYNRYTLFIIASTCIIIGLGFIFIISSGIIYILMAQYDIELMFRDRIWKAIDDIYFFGTDFWGNGWGFTTKYIHEQSERMIGVFVGGIHNDLLKVYIDLGFWGFIIYFGFFLFYLPCRYYKMGRINTSFIFLLCQLYLFMMYFTDNSQGYFACQSMAYILPFSMAESNKIGTRPNNLMIKNRVSIQCQK